MEFFTTPNSKNLIATLRIVTIETSELTFLLILYLHDLTKYGSRVLHNNSVNEISKVFHWWIDGNNLNAVKWCNLKDDLLPKKFIRSDTVNKLFESKQTNLNF